MVLNPCSLNGTSRSYEPITTTAIGDTHDPKNPYLLGCFWQKNFVNFRKFSGNKFGKASVEGLALELHISRVRIKKNR